MIHQYQMRLKDFCKIINLEADTPTKISDKQLEVLDKLVRISENHRSPRFIPEITKALDITNNDLKFKWLGKIDGKHAYRFESKKHDLSVVIYLNDLLDKKWIKWHPDIIPRKDLDGSSFPLSKQAVIITQLGIEEWEKSKMSDEEIAKKEEPATKLIGDKSNKINLWLLLVGIAGLFLMALKK